MPANSADPAELRRELTAVATRQAGYFTAGQALEVGYSYQAQRYHVQRGNWERVHRGLFRLPEWPPGDNDTFIFWRLWSGDRAVVSHDSALTVHDLGDVNPSRIHLTVPPGFRAREPRLVLHRAALPPGDIEERAGFQVTTVERTVLDLSAGDLGQEQLDTVLADAFERGLFSPRRLQERADDHGDRAALRIERALGAVSR
ncbi:type IV toxin-antitoxin system AbiEi family antitoxin domain-containing protein [Amycolatopsis sp. NPDC059027]|uniref:type IV toxin-antitoxin system AbiEi family antitoxin domain-containing protein n=1 Tax=unclassified Amycolatopsis TaxID=2618356 RepID=UPI0036710F3C